MNKIALVTGCNGGIGFATVKKFLANGWSVVGMDVATQCSEKLDNFEYVQGDLSKSDDREKFISEAVKCFGKIDALVNVAGVAPKIRADLLEMSEESYDAVIAVNQKSVYNMMKPVCSVMMKQRSGRVINVSSVAGLYGNPGQFNYSATKAAIIGMTKTAAKEFGSRNITCNAVAPGFIHTPMTDVLSDELKAKMLEQVALKRYGEPEEIASVVSFLASDDASYVTGQVIEISGGLSM